MSVDNWRHIVERELFRPGTSWFVLRCAKVLIWGPGAKRAVLGYRLACWCRDREYRRLAGRMLTRLETRYGVFINMGARIGPGLKLPHPTGIVIGKGVTIGRDCTIYQQVTLGAAGLGDDPMDRRYPHLGDGVVLYAGAKLIGGISIGDGAIIGANAVVLKDVPAGAIAVGVPAKIVSKTN